MINSIFSHITYRIIKGYRDKYIMPPVNDNDYFQDAIKDPNEAYQLISDYITSDMPCLISRFGIVELDAMLNYQKGKPLSFLRNIYPFWIGKQTKNKMQTNAGFFPINNRMLSKFSDLIVEIVPNIDVLTIFRSVENLAPGLNANKIVFPYLEPFWSTEPWTKHLKDKNVLIIHPFADSIKKQYSRRDLLFKKKDTLPDFKSLHIIKAVQSLGGINNGFNNWFDALDYMKDKIDKINYDIALIGCGAYGMPLAAYCKSQGKKAIHMGGDLQLLFGIRGKRWDEWNWEETGLFNEYWVRPMTNECPPTAKDVEDSCYW